MSAEIDIRQERLEQYEQKAIEKQHNRRKNQMLNQGFSVSKICVGGPLESFMYAPTLNKLWIIN